MNYKVEYISNKCCQTDEFANRPHESVAKSLLTIVHEHNEIRHPVIGLEGSWGSGKTQVINIFQKLTRDHEGKKKYLFLTYDIWSYQEDLTRRTFLDVLLNYATDKENKDGFESINCNSRNLERLNATTTIRSTQKYPNIRSYYACALFIPLLQLFFTTIENLFGYNEDAILSYEQVRAGLSFVLMIVCICLFVKNCHTEYKTIIRNQGDKLTKWAIFWKSISRALYFFKDTDVEIDTHETIITDEPSVSRFKKIFGELRDSIKDNTVLVIVFDNMDRLSERSKLMSVWTLLHTFFTETNNKGKIWAIVPYDSEQLSVIMNSVSSEDSGRSFTKEFLNKTFYTSLYIPEPIMTSWKKFLNDKLDKAFYPEIKPEEKNIISLIFSKNIQMTIRPRDIIAFVNRLVTLYTQHQFEEVPISVLALYSQFESEIRKRPQEEILKFTSFSPYVPLFNDRVELTKQLASIYYNIKEADSLEVVLGRSITTFLATDYELDSDFDNAYDSLSSNVAFKDYIEEYFNDPGLDWKELKPENIFYLLRQKNVSSQTKNRVYDQVTSFAHQYYATDFSTYAPWMDWLFLNADLKSTNKLISTVLQLSLESSFEDYQNAVVGFLLLQVQRENLVVNIKRNEASSVPEMKSFYENLKMHDALFLYKKCKISLAPQVLLDYLTAGVTSAPLIGPNVDTIYDLLRLLAANKYDFSLINRYILDNNTSIYSFDIKTVERIYRTFDIINPIVTNVPGYTDYSNNSFKVIPEYYAASIRHMINVESCVISHCFDQTYDKESFIPIVVRYITLSELLQKLLEQDFYILHQMCKDLLESDNVVLGDVQWLLSRTSDIKKIMSEEYISELVCKIDSKLQAVRSTKVENLDRFWLETLSQTNIAEHAMYRVIHDMYLEYVNNQKEEEWVAAFNKSSSHLETIVLSLQQAGFLPKTIWQKLFMTKVVRSVFADYVNSVNDLNIDLFFVWKHSASNTEIAQVVNYVKDQIATPNNLDLERFIFFVRLYITYSGRLLDVNNVNCFYDDYVTLFYSSCPIEDLASYTIENKDRILKFIKLCSEDRQNCFKSLLIERFTSPDYDGLVKFNLSSIIEGIS